MKSLIENFFVIDSNNISDIPDRLYGYMAAGTRVITDTDGLDADDPSGAGAYVLVTNNDKIISIYQDFTGSFGLYLYQGENGFFAISNSFLFLYENLTGRGYELTVNRDYIQYMTAADLCCGVTGITPVNEIIMFPENVIVRINIDEKKLYTEEIDYEENTVDASSPEGLKILDRWYDKWASLIRNLYMEDKTIRADLDGGFDTRLVFSLLLGGDVDLNGLFVYSAADNTQAHKEKYRIVSQIAEHYNFQLNNKQNLNSEREAQSPAEILDKFFYTKLFFHKQSYWGRSYWKKPRFVITGGGGEYIRGRGIMTPEEYVNKQVMRASKYDDARSKKTEEITSRVLSDSLDAVVRKYDNLGRPLAERDIVRSLTRETRCRNHFGRNSAAMYLSNQMVLMPLLDPGLHKLKPDSSQCEDPDFLMALIFVRYCPYLLQFPFDNEKTIDKETIRTAELVNMKNPLKRVPAKKLVREFKTAGTDLSAPAMTDHLFPLEMIDRIIREVFESDYIRKEFTESFSKSLYSGALKDTRTRKHYPLSDAFTPVGTGKLLFDRKRPEYRSMKMSEFVLMMSSRYLLTGEEKRESKESKTPVKKLDKNIHTEIREINNVPEGISLVWDAVTGADGYVIIRKNQGRKSVIAELGSEGTCFVDTGVRDDYWGKVLTYSVCVKCHGAVSRPSAPAIIQRLSDVQIVAISGNHRGEMKVWWSMARGLNKNSGYYIEYANSLEAFETDAYEKKIVNGRENTGMSSDDLKRYHTYYVRIRPWSVYVHGLTGEQIKSFGPPSGTAITKT